MKERPGNQAAVPPQKSILEGEVVTVIYQAADTGYAVVKLRASHRKHPVTAVGTLPPVVPGETLRLEGSWQNHRRFGEQFRVVSAVAGRPTTTSATERYLSSGSIRGIGPGLAARIVERYGDETLKMIDETPSKLLAVEGIGQKKLEAILAQLEQQRESRDAMIFLRGHGLGANQARKVYQKFGKESGALVRTNPYRLAHDVSGIGFVTADSIAKELGIPFDSPDRLGAAVAYVMHIFHDQGHVFCPESKLIREVAKILGVDAEVIKKAIPAAADRGLLIVEPPIGQRDGGGGGNLVFLPSSYAAETGVAQGLINLLRYPHPITISNPDGEIATLEGELNIRFTTNQRAAVEMALTSKVLVITGGPGTGKSTICSAIIRLYEKHDRNVAICAPTGRAGKRLAEVTGREAMTIHRLLGYNPAKDKFGRNESNPLRVHAAIIDETSMCDIWLMSHFLRALPAQAVLILVGDVDQLPSVGAGLFLKDIIDSGLVPTVRLTQILRQSGGSMITINAHRINAGKLPYHHPDAWLRQDYFHFEVEDPNDVLEKIAEICRDRIPEKFGLNPLTDVQVLTPVLKGPIGVMSLNERLRAALNPVGPTLTKGQKTYRLRDRVVQLINNYDTGVFNGDTGVIVAVNEGSAEILVDFDGLQVPYDFSNIDQLAPAWAITVHRSQGAEYEAIVLPVHATHYRALQRNLLYTAITRAKRLVVTVGTTEALGVAVRNNTPIRRYSSLKERLCEIANTP